MTDDPVVRFLKMVRSDEQASAQGRIVFAKYKALLMANKSNGISTATVPAEPSSPTLQSPKQKPSTLRGSSDKATA